MAKHIVLIFFILLQAAFSLHAQEPDTSYFSHPEMNEVNDEADSTLMLAKPIDTIPTPDKYVKIVLFNDHTSD